MDIKFNTKPNNRIPFEFLSVGTCCLYCGELYLKVSPRIPGEESKYDAVRLRDGTLTYFRDPDDEVRPVYTEVLVSDASAYSVMGALTIY